MELLIYFIIAAIYGSSVTLWILNRTVIKQYEKQLNVYRENIKYLNEGYGILLDKYENGEWVDRRERLDALIIERDALLAEDDRNLQEKGADNFKTVLEGMESEKLA